MNIRGSVRNMAVVVLSAAFLAACAQTQGEDKMMKSDKVEMLESDVMKLKEDVKMLQSDSMATREAAEKAAAEAARAADAAEKAQMAAEKIEKMYNKKMRK